MSDPLPLLWCDIETTGLSIDDDSILEVAVFTTDKMGMNPRNPYTWVIAPSHYAYNRLKNNEFVLNMHTKSGLLDDLAKSELFLETFYEEFIEYVEDAHSYYSVEKLTLAGSGVGPFDLPILKEHIPAVSDLLTYYVMDVGVIGRFMRNVCEIPMKERPDVNHRAMDDIQEHYNEFLEYRDLILDWSLTDSLE